jgi:hypothetical protein
MMTPHQKIETGYRPFEIMGILSIAFGVITGLLGYASRGHIREFSSSAVVFIIYFVGVGVGLIFHRKIAALFFSLALLIVAVWLAIGSIVSVPFPWYLANAAFAALLTLPSWLTWRRWSALR